MTIEATANETEIKGAYTLKRKIDDLYEELIRRRGVEQGKTRSEAEDLLREAKTIAKGLVPSPDSFDRLCQLRVKEVLRKGCVRK